MSIIVRLDLTENTIYFSPQKRAKSIRTSRENPQGVGIAVIMVYVHYLNIISKT